MARPIAPVRDRTVLITGAARGIGAETARAVAARGADVVLVGLEAERMEEVAASCGPRALVFEADVRDLGALEAAADAAVARFGGLDVVVANAGVAAVGTVGTIDPAAFDRVVEVNLLGVWRTVRATLPHVVARRGYVLAVSSLAAAVHTPLSAPYAASKAAVHAFCQSLRLEVAGSGVAVGTAYFSFLDTDMVSRSFAQPGARESRARARGVTARTYPLAGGVQALVRGIERRARTVAYPRWVGPMVLAPALAQRLYERELRRTGAGEAIGAAEAAGGSTQLTTPQAR